MQPLPNQNSPFVDGKNGVNKPWSKYLQQFTQPPPNFTALDATSFPYEAVEPGFIFIDGGVSKITLTRGLITLDCTGALFIPVSINDTVDIVGTATVAYFIPIYGASTTS
jgi:hypothetical protein